MIIPAHVLCRKPAPISKAGELKSTFISISSEPWLPTWLAKRIAFYPWAMHEGEPCKDSSRSQQPKAVAGPFTTPVHRQVLQERHRCLKVQQRDIDTVKTSSDPRKCRIILAQFEAQQAPFADHHRGQQINSSQRKIPSLQLSSQP